MENNLEYNPDMNILYIATGIRIDSFEIATIKELKKNGHNVTIVSTDSDAYTRSKIKNQITKTSFQSIMIDEIPVYVLECNLPISIMGGYCKNASKLSEKIIEKFDIVHITSWYYHPAIVFAKSAYKNKIPFIISSYATLHPENRNIKKFLKLIYDTFYTNKLIKKASGMHSVGRLETKAYMEFGVKSKNIFQINPPILRENFIKKNKTEIFSKLGLNKENDPYLLFFGRIVKRKQIELILNAFAKIHQKNEKIFLIIGGSGTKSYETELKKLAKTLKIEKNVKFTGWVTGDDKLELLEFAKILIHVPIGDSHPLAVEEALTMKVPVIITDCDMPEVEKYNAGRIIKPEINSLAETILELITNKKELEILSNNAQQLVNAEYLVEKQVKKYEQMYEKIIENYR